MGEFKDYVRRFLGLYRRSGILAFFVNHTREAKRLRLNPQQVADESHLSGAWDFSNANERKWQRHALGVIATQIGKERWGDSLEVGCSEGVFTEELAQRCHSVTGYDISPVAVARAAERCKAYDNVRIRQGDAANDEIPGQYDLVFVMDVLWLVVGRARKSRITPKLAHALREGGLLVFSDSRMPKWIRHPFWSFLLPSGADEWAKLLERTPGLTVVHKERYPPGQSIPGFWDKLFVVFRKESAKGA
jgi:SAM-dependent methyltransferase